MEVKTSRGKRLFLLFLTVVMMFTSMCSFFAAKASNSGVAVLADSNDRRAALIDFAKKKSLGDVGADSLNNLTYQDLTMLGVFASNFYVPWSTQVGEAGGEDKKVNKEIKSALVDYCNFNKDTAAALVPMIWSMSESTAQPLYITDISAADCRAKTGASDGEATWTSFLYYSTGRYSAGRNASRTISSGLSGKRTCMYWVDSSDKRHVVYDACIGDSGLQNCEFTPSTMAYACIADSLNYQSGYGGNALLSMDRDKFEALGAKDRDATFVGNAKLYVDCFGNILCDVGVARYVVIPACVNPYTWVATQDTYEKMLGGKVSDYDPETSAGLTLNMVNTFMIGRAEQGYVSRQRSVTLYAKQVSGAKKFGKINDVDYYYKYSKAQGSPYTFTFKLYTGGQSLFNLYQWRVGRGSTGTDVDNDAFLNFFSKEGDSVKYLRNLLDKATYFKDSKCKDSKSGSEAQGFFAWTTYHDVFGSQGRNGSSAWGTPIPCLYGKDKCFGNEKSGYSSTYVGAIYEAYSKNSDFVGPASGLATLDNLPTWASSSYTDLLMINNLGSFSSNKAAEETLSGSNSSESSDTSSAEDSSAESDNIIAKTDIFQDYSKPKKFKYYAINNNTGESEKTVLEIGKDTTVTPPGGSTDAWSFANYDSSKENTVLGVIGYDHKTLLSGMSAATKFNSVSKDNAVISLSGTGKIKQYMTSIYLSYVYAFFDDTDGKRLSWAFNSTGLPQAESSNIDWGDIEIDQSDDMANEVMSLAYYLMHPSKGIEIIKAWFKNKVGAMLVGWHEDMAGKATAVSTTGTTKYIGFSGYVTVPALEDVEWTNWLLTRYDSLIIYFVIIMIVIMIGYAMIGSLTLQRAIGGVLIFAFCAYLPPRVIDTTVNASNRLCDTIYGNKFTYWALVQHQQYFDDLEQALDADSDSQYLSFVFENQAKTSSDSYASVTVKWMCPKKDNYMAQMDKQLDTELQTNGVTKYIRNLVNEQTSGESFSDDQSALYLYRSYTDIAQYSRYGYGLTKAQNYNAAEGTSAYSLRTIPWGSQTWVGYFDKYTSDTVTTERWSSNLANSVSLGFNYMCTDEKDYCWRVNGLLHSNDVSQAVQNADIRNSNADDMYATAKAAKFANQSGLVGIEQKNMNFGLSALKDLNAATNADTSGNASGGTMQTSDVGDFIFASYTESPYYYFSYNLYDQAANWSGGSNAAASGSFKDMLLGGGIKSNNYFYNMTSPTALTDAQNSESISNVIYSGHRHYKGVKDAPGYGELRDYMDMRSLFTVVIPYLKQSNDVVVAWDDTQGLFMYDDVLVEYDADGNLQVPQEALDDDEIGYKFWHNVNVVQLFNMYTPWVDAMYDCDYAKETTITVAGQKWTVKDPLDPSSYYKASKSGKITAGRQMIFSESERVYYGLAWADLTEVEQKIITINENCYENLLQLMDYYTFNDDVLNTAAAMLETFEFNKEFSQYKLGGTDYVLYPQAYELKNFSYDAYLRLILANSTGESLADFSADADLNNGASQLDFYQRVVNNSSILTGIFLVLVDLFAVYAIPAFKLFIIVAVFVLSIIMILAASVKLEMSLGKTIIRSLVKPMGFFFLISVAMAFFVSLFMYEGNTDVTGRGGLSINLGDPVMVLLVMLVLNFGALCLYFKIAKGVVKDVLKYGQSVFASVGGMIGGLANGVSSGFKAGLGGAAAAGLATGGLAYAAGKGIGKLKNKIMGGKSDGAGGSGSASGGLGADTRGGENLGNDGRPEPRPVKNGKDATNGDKVATDFDKNGKRPENPYDAKIHNRYDKKALMKQEKAAERYETAQTTKRKADACRQYQEDLANGNVFERGKSKVMGKKAAVLDWSAKRQLKQGGKYAGSALDNAYRSEEKMTSPKAKKRASRAAAKERYNSAISGANADRSANKIHSKTTQKQIRQARKKSGGAAAKAAKAPK